MMWLIERRTFLIWRIVQFLIFFGILILEIIQLLGYTSYYWELPANNQTRVWIFEGISLTIIGYILAKFNHRWKNETTKDDIILDCILLAIWILQCTLNVLPAIFNERLSCELETTDLYYIAYERQTRCRLFLGSTALSYIALFTVIVTLTFSIVRWKHRQPVPLSTSDYNMGPKKSYFIQEGSLENGEPVLFFYSKNKSFNNNIHGKIVRSQITRSASISSSLPPINISISEPEIAAAAAAIAAAENHREGIPNVTVVNDKKNEEKNDSVLRC